MTRFTLDKVAAWAKAHWGLTLTRNTPERAIRRSPGSWSTGYTLSGNRPGFGFGHWRFKTLRSVAKLLQYPCAPILLLLALALCSADARAASDVPLLLRHAEGVSDAALFACACPGAVSFCTEWKQKWAKDAAPAIRNQSVRECVIDFMSALTGRDWP